MIKRTTADKWFSDCVRIRPNWHCESCGGDFYNNRELLHCSHYITRGHKSVRIHPINAFAHCARCHKRLGGDRWGGGNVAEFADFFYARRGRAWSDFLLKLSKMPFRYYESKIKSISNHYRSEFKRIEQMRNDGVVKYIEFKMFDGCQELNAIMRQIKNEVAHRSVGGDN